MEGDSLLLAQVTVCGYEGKPRGRDRPPPPKVAACCNIFSCAWASEQTREYGAVDGEDTA